MASFEFNPKLYPDQPGCYLMLDADGRILYVGKAKKLRSRLRSYFRGKIERKRTRQLVAEIAGIEVLLVNNESESLILENNLIKQHKPPYNRALKKDNSGYAYLQLTDEAFPRFDVYYRNRRTAASGEQPPDAARRFGPFLSSRFRNALKDFIADHFRIRTCTVMPKRACLLYHIGKCSGICEGMISEAEYRESVEQAAELLSTREDKLIEAMGVKMEAYAGKLEYEKAHNMMLHIRALERSRPPQIVDRESTVDQDVLYFGEDKVMVTKLVSGMVSQMQLLDLDGDCRHSTEVCDRFLIRHYRERHPHEIIANVVADPGAVKRTLRRLTRKTVRLTVPKKGLKFELLELCRQNYEYCVSKLS